MKLNIMTFNVQHFRNYNFKSEDRIDFDTFASYIVSKNPDILGLNEVRGGGEPPYYTDQPKIVSEKTGYPHYYFCEAVRFRDVNRYGNAMMSRFDFKGETIGIPNPPAETLDKAVWAEPRAVLKGEFDIEGKKLTVLSTHFGLNVSEAQNAVKTVCDIADSCDTPMILMGDFNLTPDSPVLKPIFERFEDTEPLLKGDNTFTFPSDDASSKIDYIFTRGVKVNSAQINRDIVSDHYSISAEIEI